MLRLGLGFLSQPSPLSGATASYFSKHPWLAIWCSEPLERIQIGTSIQMDLCQITSSLFFLNPELVFLKQAEQSRAQMIFYWKGCNAVYSVWTVLMFFRLLRFEKHLCHRPLDAGATCYQLRELMLLWLTAIWYNNERTSSPQKICWCVYILNLMVLTQAGKFVCSFLH